MNSLIIFTLVFRSQLNILLPESIKDIVCFWSVRDETGKFSFAVGIGPLFEKSRLQ